MALHRDALDALEATSRTFFVPITRLPEGLQEAVGSAYLCMRAIDEIEDHAQLDASSKIRHLRAISQHLQAQTTVDAFALDDFATAFGEQRGLLPEVTTRIGEWARLAPQAIAPRIWDATAAMAERMAHWVATGWKIQTVADLDRYTFGVAGAVGILLCDILAWFDGFQLERSHAIHFGRGLQAVNILRNRTEDLARGVDFFPDGWQQDDVWNYAHHNLTLADAYTRALPPGPVAYFIQIPLALAYATLTAIARGEKKLSRSAVVQLIRDIQGD